MLSILPIDEYDVILSLNQGRFEEPLEGYIMMDGAAYKGHALFRVQDGVTTVLEAGVEDALLMDGIVRACIAAGENRGAGHFLVNREQQNLADWWDRYCAEAPAPAPTSTIFSAC